MSEHILPQKTVQLIANGLGTLTWNAPDFGQAFPESIIKQKCAMRLSCSTTSANSVNIGVRYSTLTKDYRVAERSTIAAIPPNGTVEITPASVAALGLLQSDITSITVECTSQASGDASISLILDDDPPPLSNDAGNFFGLDDKLNQDYQLKFYNLSTTVPSGSGNTIAIYSTPARKRFFMDTLFVSISPTPSYPGQFTVEFDIFANIAYMLRSKTEEFSETFVTPPAVALNGGDFINMSYVNQSGSPVAFTIFMQGRELF